MYAKTGILLYEEHVKELEYLAKEILTNTRVSGDGGSQEVFVSRIAEILGALFEDPGLVFEDNPIDTDFT